MAKFVRVAQAGAYLEIDPARLTVAQVGLYIEANEGSLIDFPPTGLVCSVVSSVQINITWVDNSTDELGFKIERSEDGVTWGQIAIVGAGVTTYDDVGLEPNNTYWYRVRAYK